MSKELEDAVTEKTTNGHSTVEPLLKEYKKKKRTPISKFQQEASTQKEPTEQDLCDGLAAILSNQPDSPRSPQKNIIYEEKPASPRKNTRNSKKGLKGQTKSDTPGVAPLIYYYPPPSPSFSYSSTPPPVKQVSGRLFVGGLSWKTSEESMWERFSEYGEILETAVMRSHKSGQPRGFGFVVFGDPQVAEKLSQQQYLDLDGRKVEVKIAVPREEITQRSPNKTKKLFVGGLSWSTTQEDFREYFETFGTVVDAQIIYEHDSHRPRGFGYATFDSEATVEKVIAEGPHEIRGKIVDVKRAHPKNGSSSRNFANTADYTREPQPYPFAVRGYPVEGVVPQAMYYPQPFTFPYVAIPQEIYSGDYSSMSVSPMYSPYYYPGVPLMAYVPVDQAHLSTSKRHPSDTSSESVETKEE